MNQTIRHTEYLLTSHDCVVVPGFGAILRRRGPAHIDAEGRFIGPCCTYAFNPEVSTGDGLLQNSIVRACGITGVSAEAVIARDVEAMTHQLDTEGRLTLGRIGTVVRNEDGSVLFEPYAQDALTPLASWLPKLEITPAAVADSPADAGETGPVVLRPRPSRLRRFVRAAAAVVAVAVVTLVCSTPVRVDNAVQATTSLPAVTAPRPAYVPSATPAVLSLRYDGSGSVAVDTAARAAYQKAFAGAIATQTAKAEEVRAARPAAVSSAATAARRLDGADPYIVVIASLANMDDARTFAEQAKARTGAAYGIARSGRYCRVYAATGATRAQAQAALNAGIVRQFPGAWVCENAN